MEQFIWIALVGILLFFAWQAAQEVLQAGEPLVVIPTTTNATSVPTTVQTRRRTSARKRVESTDVKVSKVSSSEGCPSSDEFKTHEVRFAGRWYACRPDGDTNRQMGLCRVILGDRRTHQRVIVRRIDEIRRTKG